MVIISNNLIADRSDFPPVPEPLADEITFCRCKNTCITKRCLCLKVGMVCTEFCYCSSACKNVEYNSEPD